MCLTDELGITLGGGEALMPEEFLNGPQISPFFEHVRTESVAKGMRMHIRRKAFGDGNALDYATYAARSEAASTLIDEQRWYGFFSVARSC